MMGGIISEMYGGSFSQGAIIGAVSAAASMGLNEMTKTSQGIERQGTVEEGADRRAQADLEVSQVEKATNATEPKAAKIGLSSKTGRNNSVNVVVSNGLKENVPMFPGWDAGPPELPLVEPWVDPTMLIGGGGAVGTKLALRGVRIAPLRAFIRTGNHELPGLRNFGRIKHLNFFGAHIHKYNWFNPLLWWK